MVWYRLPSLQERVFDQTAHFGRSALSWETFDCNAHIVAVSLYRLLMLTTSDEAHFILVPPRWICFPVDDSSTIGPSLWKIEYVFPCGWLSRVWFTMWTVWAAVAASGQRVGTPVSSATLLSREIPAITSSSGWKAASQSGGVQLQDIGDTGSIFHLRASDSVTLPVPEQLWDREWDFLWIRQSGVGFGSEAGSVATKWRHDDRNDQIGDDRCVQCPTLASAKLTPTGPWIVILLRAIRTFLIRRLPLTSIFICMWVIFPFLHKKLGETFENTLFTIVIRLESQVIPTGRAPQRGRLLSHTPNFELGPFFSLFLMRKTLYSGQKWFLPETKIWDHFSTETYP